MAVLEKWSALQMNDLLEMKVTYSPPYFLFLLSTFIYQCLQKNVNDRVCGTWIQQTKNLPFVFFVLSTVCLSPIYHLLYLSHI